MTRSPASASENRAHGAEKIGPRRYSDFFNKNRSPTEVRCNVRHVCFYPHFGQAVDATRGPSRADTVEKVESLTSLQIPSKHKRHLRLTLTTAADRFRTRSVESEADDEVPRVRIENRAHGAEKIGPRRYSDFFNRIGHNRTHHLCAATKRVLFNHLVGGHKQRRGHGETECLRGLEIDDKLESCR